MLENLDKGMTIDALNSAINVLDKSGDFGIADTLFELIQALRNEWEMTEDE